MLPLDIGPRYHVDIWMTYHPDARTVARVDAFTGWLRSLFDPKRYPWFGDEFIHPSDFGKVDTPARVNVAQMRPVATGHALPIPAVTNPARNRIGSK